MNHYIRMSLLSLCVHLICLVHADDRTPQWNLLFDSRYSTVKVEHGATFHAVYPKLNWDGTLIREDGGTVLGAQITFVDGLLEDAGNQILLSAVLDPMNTLYLSDGGFFKAEPGNILQSILVSGDNNYLGGQPVLNFPITLADSATTLTIAVQSQMNKNIALNGGKLVLQNDLVFSDNAIITGNGEVHGNTYAVKTGGVPFAWTSSINWYTNIVLNTNVDFTGSFTFNAPQNTIQGNGFVYNLTGGGVLTVASGSTLTMSDVVIKGLGNGAGFGKIILEDDTASLVLTNVTFILGDDYTTSSGVVQVLGPTTVVVQDHFWTFDSSALLEVDSLTMWKDVAGAETCGDILFDALSNVSLVDDGIIEYITLKCHSIIENFDSRIDLLESCCEANDSRIDILESRADLADSCCEANDSRIDLTESCCEANGSRIDILESRADLADSCCEINDSRIDLLESCCEANDSRIDILESRIDTIVTATDVISRLDVLESCCEANGSRIDLMESCCEANGSRIDVLVSEIDNIVTVTDVTSRLDLLESCCEANGSRIDLTESCCEANDSRIDILESRIDTIVTATDVISRLDVLESCCEANGSRIDILESQIDTITTETCITRVCADLYFDLSMLPGPYETRVFEFCKCSPCRCSSPEDSPPRVIFDPAVYGNAGRIVLPKGSTLMFTGCGTVDLKDGVIFELDGTPFGPTRADWPQLILDGGAQMIVEAGGTAIIGGGAVGAGCFITRQGGSVMIDNNSSQLIFGETVDNEMLILSEIASHMTVDNPTALMSFHLGTFDLIFDNNSALQALQGTIEMNTLNGAESPGFIRFFEFHNDSALIIPGVCGQTFGVLRLAPNISNANMSFDNLTGHVAGNGDLQYVSFSGGSEIVNSVIQVQNNHLDITQPVVNSFMELGYILKRGLIPPPDATILALRGSRPDQTICGQLVAFCPARDGSIVGLAQGDHDVFYDSSVSCGTLDLVRGYDRLGRVFTIANCDETTRRPPAPPLT